MKPCPFGNADPRGVTREPLKLVLPPSSKCVCGLGSLCASAAHLCGLGCSVFPQRLPCLRHPQQVPRAILCLNSLAKEFAVGFIYFSVQLFPELQPGSTHPSPPPPAAGPRTPGAGTRSGLLTGHISGGSLRAWVLCTGVSILPRPSSVCVSVRRTS